MIEPRITGLPAVSVIDGKVAEFIGVVTDEWLAANAPQDGRTVFVTYTKGEVPIIGCAWTETEGFTQPLGDAVDV